MKKRWASKKSLVPVPEEEEADTELTTAVVERDLERMRRLMRKGSKVNERNCKVIQSF